MNTLPNNQIANVHGGLCDALIGPCAEDVAYAAWVFIIPSASVFAALSLGIGCGSVLWGNSHNPLNHIGKIALFGAPALALVAASLSIEYAYHSQHR